MYAEYPTRKRKNWPVILFISAVVLVLIGLAAYAGVRTVYNNHLSPVSNTTEEKIVAIENGSTVAAIAGKLKSEELIRSASAFEHYAKSRGLASKLQAGTYKLSPSLSTPEIVRIMTDGKVAVDLFTILPGKRIDQIRQAFIDAKFDAAEVDAALQPGLYSGSPALAGLPAGASLEGYLYPDSYQKELGTKAENIVRQSLQQMEKNLTADVLSGFSTQGLTPHEGIILASIVEKEVPTTKDREQAAQVFLSRIEIGMPLASDATAPYGAILAGETPSLRYASAYNTYANKGLPPGPISNVTGSSLRSVARPATTDWLYFVSGDDRTTHFSKTLKEHEELTRRYCTVLCN